MLFVMAGVALALGGCNAADPEPQGPAISNIAAKATEPPPAANAQHPALTKVDEVEFQTAAEPAAAPDPGNVTRAWFAGRWTDTGDCAQAGEFAANGSNDRSGEFLLHGPDTLTLAVETLDIAGVQSCAAIPKMYVRPGVWSVNSLV